MRRSLFIALILLSLIWGGSFFFIKMLLHDFGPWTIAFLRASCGLATIAIIMLVLRKPFNFHKIPWIPMAGVALLNTAIPWAFIGFSETRLTSTMASVLNATTPLWTVIIGMLFFRSASNLQRWLGMGAAFIGLIVLLDINPVTFISVDLFGLVCMISATLCYAVGSQLSNRYLGGLSIYQLSFGTLLSGILFSGSVALALEPISFSPLASLTNIAVLIGLGVFGSGIAYILFYYLLQKGSPELATMVTYLVPASAMIWGYTFLNEEIKWSLLTGLAFILGGVFLANKKPQSKKPTIKREQRASSL